MRQCPKCAKRFLESNARICDVDGAVLDLLVVASERDRLVGTTILGRYNIDGVLGDGGMGVVYRAKDTATGAPYAVKVLRAEYSEEEDLVVRFEQEARASAAINNPHIVEIYDWGSLPDNSRFFVMEFLDGRSLGDVMADMPRVSGSDRRRSLGEAFTIHIATQICEGLGAAHDIGIVHRDIKPDNFHLVRRGEDPYFVKILDFGIAKVQNSKAARTRTGSVFGTPHYMSPEQASGDRNMDHSTDIYGLGVLMYEMIVGKVPFDAENLMGILTAHLYHSPTPPRVYPECDQLSAGLEAIILKCLAKSRDARYPSMRALYADLARVRDGELSLALEDQDSHTMPFDRALFASLDGDQSATRPELLVPPEFRAPSAIDPAPQGRDKPTSPSVPAVMRASAPPPPSSPPAALSGAYGSFSQDALRFAAPPSVPGVMVDAGHDREASRRMRRNALLAVGVVALGVSLGVASFALLGEEPATAQPAVTAPAPLVDATPAVAAPPPTPTPHPPTPAPLRVAPPAVSATVTIRTTTSVVAAVRRRQGAEWIPVGFTPTQVVRPAAGEDVYRVESPGLEPVELHVTSQTPSDLAVVLERHGHRHRDRDRDRDQNSAQPTSPAPAPAPAPAPTPAPHRNDGLHDPFG
jgi:serine/threonine protein kinase